MILEPEYEFEAKSMDILRRVNLFSVYPVQIIFQENVVFFSVVLRIRHFASWCSFCSGVPVPR